MKKIPLTRGQYASVDDENYDDLMQFKWSAQWAPSANTFYAIRTIKGGHHREYMHRRIMKSGPDEQVDHWDHNGINNLKKNLRMCSGRENKKNRRDQSRHGVGIRLDARHKFRPYCVSIKVQKRRIELGSFPSVEEAQKERATAEMVFALAGCP